MLLAHTPWPEVEGYLARRTDILIPIGATEQHGPYGPIGTDWICAEGVARAAGERAGILVGPTLQVGMSLHHLRFPGSMALKPSTMMAVLGDWAAALYGHGLRRLHLVNGHGGNIATVQAAFPEIYLRCPGLRCRISSWYALPSVDALLQERLGDAEGHHATPGELSLAWHLHPEARRVTAPQSPPAPDTGIYDADDFRQRYPDGRVGADQHRADPEFGRALLEAAVVDLLAQHAVWLGES
ncbi:MAG: creatininase family protein [Pseudomonadota bacterium]